MAIDFQFINLKAYCDGDSTDLQKYMETFNTWIREKTIAGENLIDVVDYSHMHHGPGVVLVGHEANWSIDEAEGRRGLLYGVKVVTEGDLSQKLNRVFGQIERGCALMKEAHGVNFDTSSFRLIVNDRLLEKSEATYDQLEAGLDQQLAGKNPKYTRDEDPLRRVIVNIELS